MSDLYDLKRMGLYLSSKIVGDCLGCNFDGYPSNIDFPLKVTEVQLIDLEHRYAEHLILQAVANKATERREG